MNYNNFGASGSILTKHFPYDVPRGMGITFGRSAPYNLRRQKNPLGEGEKRPKFSAIFDNFRL